MNIKLKILCLLFILPACLFSKQILRFKWEENPVPHKLTAELDKESAVIIDNFVREEYYYNHNNNIDLYRTVHKIIKLNDDKAIERYNKIYVSMHNVDLVVEIKGRSISKNGVVKEVEKSAMKVLDQNDNNGSYKIFAIDGLEIGSEVEYYYIVKKYPVFFAREFMQHENPTLHSRIEIISPEKILFKSKCYNQFPPLKDTVIEERNYLIGEATNIPELRQEEYSASSANLMRVEIKISKSTEKEDKDLLTWQDAARTIYERIYLAEHASNYRDRLDRILKDMHMKNMDETAQVCAIENYIKTNFALKGVSGDEFNNFNNILKNRYTGEAGMVKLFAGMLTEANIKHEIVLTTDRKEIRFDGEFESWNYLDNYLIFFPDLNKYIAPAEMAFRFPMFPALWSDNDGLFIKTITLSKKEMGYGEIKHIPTFDADISYDDHDISIKFNDDLSDATMHVKRSMSGFNAMNIQPYIKLITEEKRNDEVIRLLKDSEKESKAKNTRLENDDYTISPFYKPFIVEGDLVGTGFLEQAGKDYLFKIGTVIGPQGQLYAEKKRENAVELENKHRYNRNISFNIPKGYKIKNLADLNLDVSHSSNGVRDFSFTSSYKMDGDRVIIKVEEFYKSIAAPLTEFETFRKVINASADFNKVTLVIEKE